MAEKRTKELIKERVVNRVQWFPVSRIEHRVRFVSVGLSWVYQVNYEVDKLVILHILVL
jgi:hypothetical protein